MGRQKGGTACGVQAESEEIMMTRNGKIYLGTIITAAIILTLILIMAVPASADNKEDDIPTVEKVMDIDGTKSVLFYCNETGSYLIYSKKSGNWVELQSDEGEWEYLERPVGDENSPIVIYGKSVKGVSRNEAE